MKKRDLLQKFDNRFKEIIGNMAFEIYDIGKDPNDYMYFKDFYRDTLDKLIKVHQKAHNTIFARDINKLFDEIIDIKTEWSFIKNQYYKFINFKNGVNTNEIKVDESGDKEDNGN